MGCRYSGNHIQFALDPRSAEGHYNLARLLLMTGRLDEAFTEAEKARDLGIKQAPDLMEAIKAKKSQGKRGTK